VSGSPFWPNALDRLSNWIGAFVPGCARLPTRHPVKVSIVMGGLGLLAGWLTVAPVVALEAFGHYNLQWLFNLFPGALLSVVVFLPLMAWQQRPAGVMLLSLPLAWGAGFLHMVLIAQIGRTDEGPTVEGFVIAGALAGAIYAAAGIVVNTRREWWMLLPVISVSGLIHGALVATTGVVQPQMLNLPFQLHMLVYLAFAANLFSSVYAALGITLGSALWDRTEPPKFESVENTDGA
jgi:hypothetical protein